MPDLTPPEALLHIMVTAAAADSAVSTTELQKIGVILDTLPAFQGFDRARIEDIASDCARILEGEDGLQRMLEKVHASLPEKLYETAYALAIEVAASDVVANQAELRFLQMIRDELDLEPLGVAAIERSARVRYRRP